VSYTTPVATDLVDLAPTVSCTPTSGSTFTLGDTVRCTATDALANERIVNYTVTVKAVTISWDPNRETAVNMSGGGYKVYISTSSGFDITDAGVSVVDVPFVSGPTAPTSTSLQLLSATTYYARVIAYSALNPPGGSTSAPSDEHSFVVP
jgi:hypothetical protein